MPIPIIDLFAGPGGLGEGFSSLRRNGRPVFKIRLSIEMDEHAHHTLELRAFSREFPDHKLPLDYYRHLTGEISREELFKRHPRQAANARQEAWRAEMGGKNTPAREVHKRIYKALGPRVKNWILIGGPPCQAYSLVGRSRVINVDGLKSFESDPRHRLYKHYLRILAVHQPPVFVMENVKGLLSVKLRKKHVFDRILEDLKCPTAALPKVTGVDSVSYNLFPLAFESGNLPKEFKPEDFILKAEKYGVPQARHRIIILGIRSDLKQKHGPLVGAEPVTVRKAIGDLPPLRSGLSKLEDSPVAWREAIKEITKAVWFRDHELRKEIKKVIRRIKVDRLRGCEYVSGTAKSAIHPLWFSDPRLKGICNHETRAHIKKDLHRYLFAAVFAQVRKRSPLLEDFPRALLPHHKNVKAALKENKFNDRFRVQVAGRPSTTIVSHISKDGHYYIHYNPTQCRSLTVREAARLQTFPDNYLFVGPRTEQYHQVGNAVPPFLARQIAKIVANLMK